MTTDTAFVLLYTITLIIIFAAFLKGLMGGFRPHPPIWSIVCWLMFFFPLGIYFWIKRMSN